MKSTEKDYTNMTKVCREVNLIPTDRPGFYIPIQHKNHKWFGAFDLTASGEDKISILINVSNQAIQRIVDIFGELKSI